MGRAMAGLFGRNDSYTRRPGEAEERRRSDVFIALQGRRASRDIGRH